MVKVSMSTKRLGPTFLRRAKEIMVKISEPLNSRVHVQCTVHHLNQCQDLRVLILSRIVNRHMELQTNEGHPFERKLGRFDIVLVFCYTQSQAKSKKVIT